MASGASEPSGDVSKEVNCSVLGVGLCHSCFLEQGGGPWNLFLMSNSHNGPLVVNRDGYHGRQFLSKIRLPAINYYSR